MVKAVNHIGIAVNSISEHRPFYEQVLGARFEGEEVVKDQQVKVGFFIVGPDDHAVRIELLEPTSSNSTIAAFLQQRGEGLHHVAYTVADLPERLKQLQEDGIRLIDAKPRPGAHHTQIAFLHPKSSGRVLTELVEEARNADSG